ncbi:MAG TPA: glycosyltransferase, partial [Chitinophagaceae bacterium]
MKLSTIKLTNIPIPMAPDILKYEQNQIKEFNNFIDLIVKQRPEHLDCECTGRDPQIHLLPNHPLKRGWYIFEYSAVQKKGRLNNPKLYFDTGNGYNETNVIPLPASNKTVVSEWVYFSKTVHRLRFDPTEDKFAIFTLHLVSLKKQSRFTVLKQLINKGIESAPGKGIQNYVNVISTFLKNDVKEIRNKLKGFSNDPFKYRDWINKYDTYTDSEIHTFKILQSNFQYRPLISIVLPAYNTPLEWLKECINSVFSQVYDNWELCIADDNSSNENVKASIKGFAEKTNKIKYVFKTVRSGISAASNTALSLSSGEFITFLDHDDLLHPLALYRIVESLNKDKTIDFLYSDEDKIDISGRRISPFFKPDWSPALIAVQNYIAHLACIRKSYVLAVDGFTKDSDGSQDYDLFLKIFNKNPKIQHLPFILYHWRQHSQSTSLNGQSKPYAQLAGKASLEKYLTKKYADQFSHIEDSGHVFIYKPRFKFDKLNKVSIIIPTKDKIEYLKPCIESIIKKSTWSNYEILVLNNNSSESKTHEYFEKIKTQKNIRVIDASFSFNWSKLNNFGARHATGNFLIFLNNDI